MIQLSVNEIETLVKEKYLNNKRLDHILGVARLAKELAAKFNLDEEKAYIAGLLHDYCKYESTQEMLEIINDKAIEEKFKDAPQVLHAHASYVMAKDRFHIKDEDILNGIKNHVYGRVGMTLFEKIIVISDFCEDGRTYARCKETRKVLDAGDFNLAMYMCIKYTIESVLESGNTPLEEQYEILKELESLI